MKQLYLLTLLAILAFTGCKKDDASRPENLTVEQTEYTLDAVEKRTATVSFTAADDWTLSVVYDDAESSADWLTVTPASGTAGKQTVELLATSNLQATSRTAYADLVCGEQSVRLTITQTAVSDDTDFTALFDEVFAQELQRQGIIADADNITPEDMEKIAAITSLNVAWNYSGTLTSLRGIEYFESLRYLNCYYNQLTSLDVSRNTALTYLDCHGNLLPSLDVSRNTALTDLDCNDNLLPSLDVSRNTALTYLSCRGNQLTSLDVSRNTALTELYCYNNSLTTLDVSRNTALTWLWCYDNQLKELDVSRNTALTELYCSDNQLTSLDVSRNTKLIYLNCAFNELTSLDVSRNTSLTYLFCDSNQLTKLDMSQNTALTELGCGSNQLTTLDVSQNTALTKLDCLYNQLTSLDVSRNTALTWLWCANNPGDGVSIFPITAWFDNDTKPGNLEIDQEQWTYGDKTITLDFRKAE